MKILVVDDKQWNRDAAVEQLGADHELTVYNGTEYQIDLGVGLTDYDVILTDLWMPSKEGGEEQPLGDAIVLKVLTGRSRNGGALQRVVIYTDVHHHRRTAPRFPTQGRPLLRNKGGCEGPLLRG